MHLQQVSITNFRNLQQFSHQFPREVIVLIAPNGTGKTNLLEALHYLSTGKSPRAEKEHDLVRWNQKMPAFARLHGTVTTENPTEITITLEQKDDASKRITKKVLVNDTPRRATFLSSVYPSLFFTPDTLTIIAGSPEKRRSFFNQICGLFDQQYSHWFTQYTKVVQQRNRLLQQAREQGKPVSKELMLPWNTQLIEYGAHLLEVRNSITSQVNTFLDRLSPQLHQHDQKQHLVYQPNIPNIDWTSNETIKNAYATAIEHAAEKEYLVATTLKGPHRDDWLIYLNTMLLKTFGSRGQQRMGSIALLMSSFLLLSDQLQKKPVLLLDDLFSELDEKHSELLLTFLDQQHSQIFLSATSESVFHSSLPANSTIINLQGLL